MNLDNDDLRRAQMVMIISRPVRKHKEASVWPVQWPSKWWCRARAPGRHNRHCCRHCSRCRRRRRLRCCFSHHHRSLHDHHIERLAL